jgi:hypothetical protein
MKRLKLNKKAIQKVIGAIEPKATLLLPIGIMWLETTKDQVCEADTTP